MFKKDESKEQTLMYLESDLNLDEALKSYEYTLEEAKETKAGKKKIIIIISAIVFAVCAVLIFMMLFFKKSVPCTVVKNADNSFSICNAHSFKLNQQVSEYKINYKKSIFIFTNENGNLFFVDLKKCNSNNDIKLVAEKVENDFSILNDNLIIYKSSGSLFYYNLSEKNAKKISDKISGYFLCENSKAIYYLTNDKRLFVFDFNQSKEILSDVEKIECFKNDEKLNLIITQNNKLYFANENGSMTLLSDKFYKYFCSNKNGIFHNIYFLEKSPNTKIENIIFEDKYKQSDLSLKEPSSSDYRKSLAFGLISFVDPAQYKQAYMNYQEKVLRDKIRSFAENYKNSGEFYNLFCFDREKISLIKNDIKPDEILSFSSSENPFVFYRNIFENQLSLEISDLQSEIKISTDQKDFNKIINEKFKEKNNLCCEIFNENSSIKFNFEKIKNNDEILFSKNCDSVIIKNSDTFSLYNISENGVKKMIENEKYSSMLFNENQMYFIKNETLFSVDLSSSKKETVLENTDSIFLQNGSLTAYQKATQISGNYFLIENSTGHLLCENSSDIIYIDDSNYSFISDGKLITKYNGKEFINENAVSIIK